MRFEEPDPRNRWDSPCFTIAPEDDLIERYGEALIEALIFKKGTKPHTATHKSVVTPSNYLHDMDKTLGDIVARIIESQKDNFSDHDGLVVPRSRGKVHGSLARAGKVKGQTPKVEKQEKRKKKTGRAKKRIIYNRRFVNVVAGFGGKKRQMNPAPTSSK
ncbi:hypothetical protein SmJEL517_g00891 [Synchytrium microbalum]|uniref:Uncharacterized protein n=1 Tax=Synchytrium microbalum TaxID=1806994 RepID=A0A507C7Y5_9FUNG|nr:uncharacterized protein SmJEL517_g00891 [Synchytrium microbalum]TPX37167.1 hypothetical protein SmJEL517_g00891 [Synchytrium microbalum]